MVHLPGEQGRIELLAGTRALGTEGRIRRRVVPERGIVTAGIVVQLGDREAGRDTVPGGERRIGEQGFELPYRLVRDGDAAGQRQVAPRIREPRLDREGTPEAADRRRELPGGAQRAAQPVPRLREARRAGERTAEALRRPRDVARPILRQTQRIKGRGIVRPQRERTPMAGECGGEVLALGQQQTEPAQRRRLRGIEPQRAAQACLGRAEPALMEQGEAELCVPFHEVRRECQRPPRRRLRRRMMPAFPLRTGEVRVHLRDVGAQFGRAGVACDRVGRASGEPQRVAEIGVRIGEFGQQQQRPPDQRRALLGAPALGRDHAEQVQGIGVVRRARQDGAIGRLCLGQPAGAMLRERRLERRAGAGGGAGGEPGAFRRSSTDRGRSRRRR